ncbi:MAG TPA: BlaI/MecI/CopY family transcriptional regulator [Verrucomicrobiae bacterium]|jgi:BlaI family penicillinase repressor
MPNQKSKSLKANAKTELPKISDAEWVVMRVVWDKAPVTANQVVESLSSKMHWKPKTVHTLLTRLAQKGALVFEKLGREYQFRPMVSAEECEHAATRSFLGRFFGGELAPFLARFMESEKLKPEEIEQLKRILDQKAS